jgi:hypothetical protein
MGGVVRARAPKEAEMSSRWWFPFDGMEEMSFKRVPEGWVYRVPNPWLLGRSRYYLVSEKQKSEIAGHHRQMWLILLLGIAVITAVGAPLTLAGFDEQQVVLSLATAALLGLIVGFAANAWLCRTIRPIIANLTPTTQRITQSEVLNTQIAVFSRGYLLFFGSLSLLLFALIALQPLLTSAGWDARSLIGALLFGAGTIYWFALYIAKRRQSVARAR